MLLQQCDHGERLERRHQSGALLEHVLAVLNGADDGRIRGWATHPHFFHGLHQRCLGIASRWLSGVTGRLDALRAEWVANLDGGQTDLAILQYGIGIVGALHIGPQEPGERDDFARGGELCVFTRGRCGPQPDLGTGATGVGHLRRNGTHPYQFIQAELVVVDLSTNIGRGSERLTGGPDGLVGLLRVLDLLLVATRLIGNILTSVQLGHLGPGGGERSLGQRGGVRPHVRDVAPLVQTLGNTHGALRGETKLAPRFLLQRRRHERCIGRTAIRLLLHRADRERSPVESGHQPAGVAFGEDTHAGALQQPVFAEIAPCGQSFAVQRHHGGAEGDGFHPLDGRAKRALQIPVASATETHPGSLTLHHQSGGHTLNAARRQARHDLLPQYG